MPFKKKNKVPVAEPEPEDAVIYNTFANLELTKICPEKIFEIIFIAETDENTNEIMKRIIHTSREYEEISCVTFITYNEVIDILEFFSKSAFPLVLQLYLNDIIQETKIEFIENNNIPSSKLAQLMKLKLIEIMYQHYQKEVNKMEKRKSLEDELHILSVDTKKGGGLKKTNLKDELKKVYSLSTNLESKRSKPKISEKSLTETSIFENMNLSSLETENDIVFDDDISNQVWFYVFHGFYDLTVLKQLISVFKIPVRAIIKIRSDNLPNIQKNEIEHVKLNIYETFWRDISDNFDGPHRSNVFENTILMKYDVFGDKYRELFEGLLYVIKSISEVKCKHLNYIRHMKIHEFENVPEMLPLHCLYTYNNLLHHLPTELVDEYIVLSGLLEEIESRADNKKVLELGRNDGCEIISGDSITSSNCTSPFHVDETFPSSQKYTEKNIPTERMDTGTFLTYEGDIIQIVSKTYRNCGILIDRLLGNIWKKLVPINLLEKIENNFSEISHSHDFDPSTNTKREETDILSHFLYLFLFNIFENGESFEVPRYSESIENLQTHDKMMSEKLLKPTIVNDGSCDDFREKLYDPSPMEYIWKEQLALSILAQELLRAQQDYVYTNLKYSPETDDLLVQLSDNLDEFGSSTEIYEETVLTPVCLRDFCKYISVEQAKWLEQNKPPKYVRKQEIREQCEGVNKIKKLDLFENYRYLLDSRVVLDEDIHISDTNVEEVEASFESILEQLKKYPTNEKLIDECRRSDINKNLLVYDFGTKYFSIRGAKTIFSSHDNVKITVENTGMIDEEPRCSVNLSCMNNNLYLHSKLSNEYTFHYTLENKTIISFILQDCKKKVKPNISTHINNFTEVAEDIDIGHGSDIETSSFSNSNTKVIAVNSDDFEKEFLPDYIKSFDPNICTNLKQAIAEGYSIYKVSSKLKYTRKLNDKPEIPLGSILRRFIHETSPKQPLKPLTKTFASLNDKSPGLTVTKSVDFRICLPNGLYITCYPSQINDNLNEIKQEYLYHAAVPTEEFRLFTRDGTVLIKKTDGSITLLKSNGDAIFFEKPDSEDDCIRQSNLKKCHCKGIDDYRKKVNNILKRNDDESRRYMSRRAVIQTKKGYIISENLAKVLENSKVPYLRKVLVGFGGNKTTLEKNKITQKKVFHTTCEQDFFAEEIYFEREDGMQSIFNKFGSQIVKFADGTKISSTVYESKVLMDGYVYVSLHFLYEHPYYATVSYSPEDVLKISLCNNVCLERYSNDKIAMKIGCDITTVITEKTVEFEKLCKKCNSNYICSFNISQFLDKKFDPSLQFLHAQDSYNKHFYVDFEGHCKRNANFLNGPNNAFGCNHYKNNIYKKLFIIKRTSGAQLWSEGMIKLKQKNESDYDVKAEFDHRNLDIIQFKKFHFESYANRYSNTKMISEELCLSKYKKISKRTLLYTTIRVIKKVVDPKKINDFLFIFMSYLENNEFDDHTNELMRIFLKDSYANLEVVSSMNSRTEGVISEYKKTEKCKCRKIKRLFSEKTSRWQGERDYFRKILRDPKIPIYFKSQFCGIIERMS